MSWKIEFYSNEVQDSIHAWPTGIGEKFLRIIDLIEDFGPADVGSPHIEPFGKGLKEIVLARKRMREVLNED